MKSKGEINRARDIVARQLTKPTLSDEQRVVLNGMAVALQWVCEDREDNTLELLFSGRGIVMGAAPDI